MEPTTQRQHDGRTGSLRLRDAAAVALGVTSGATDAISFIVFGGAFTSVMTGNLVLLGISVAHADGVAARQVAVAIIGYIAGCAVGSRIAGTASPGDPVWPPAIARGIGVEACLFVVYAAGWWASGARPAGPVAAGLLGVSAIALGIQSSTVRRFGEGGLSTTYLTGTLTTLVISLSTGHRLRDVSRHLLILIALVCGAVLAALLLQHVPGLVPLIQLVPLTMVLGLAFWQTRVRPLPAPTART